MSDQAQGLRALADQARRDQSGYSPDATRGVVSAPDCARPAHSHSVPSPTVPFAAPDVALADARLHRRAPNAGPRRARVIAVTSGKGGVGKTNFSTNLSLALAQSQQRVIVLDADFGLANLHVVLGITPRYHLEHVMRGEKTMQEILYPGPGGIQIVAGGSGIAELANMDERTRVTFLAGLSELDELADVIVIDTGAGLSRNVLAFLCAVQEIIVITTPEPTSITDAYATIKVASQENPGARIMLVVNMAQSEQEAQSVASKMTQIARQFLRLELECLGYIPQDPAVPASVRAQQPFSLGYPGSAATRHIVRVAAQLGYQLPPDRPSGGVSGFLNQVQRFFSYRGAAKTGSAR